MRADTGEGEIVVVQYRDSLRKLAMGDNSYIESILAGDYVGVGIPELDAKTSALISLGALVVLGASTPSYQLAVESALVSGATPDEIVDTLIVLMPTAGAPRVTAAAPRLALALGYDTDAALEELDDDPP